MNEKKFFIFVGIMPVLFLVLIVQNSEGEGDYAGTAACMECHEDQYENYKNNYHAAKGDPRTPAARKGCESCHGPGAVHAEEEDQKKIISLSPRSPLPSEKKNAPCLECHTKGKLALWHGSAHENRALSCSDCHRIHGGFAKSRARPTQREVCIRCHKRIRAELLRQSHHPIREGKIKCGDCHNPHGTIADKLVDAQYVNIKCFACHADVRGPFLWEHPPAVEDCLTCHTPHGSPRNALLKGKMPYLCQRCHSDKVHSGNLYARDANQAGQSVYRVLSNRVSYRACLNCHVTIHGSNHPSGKTLLR